jgi:hypothetical protein
MNARLLFTATLLTVCNATAQVLFTYDFASNGDLSAKSVDAALVTSVSNFATAGAASLIWGNNLGQTNIGPGTDAAGTAYTLGQFVNNYGQSSGYSATFDGTNANGLYGASASDYIQFTFTAADTYLLDTLDFDLAMGGASGPRGFAVTSNLNGGAFNLRGVAALNVGAASQWARYSFDFGSLALTDTDTVEVRFHGFSTGTGNSFRLDNVSVTAIPEPSTLLLVGAGLLGVLMFRRRK